MTFALAILVIVLLLVIYRQRQDLQHERFMRRLVEDRAKREAETVNELRTLVLGNSGFGARPVMSALAKDPIPPTGAEKAEKAESIAILERALDQAKTGPVRHVIVITVRQETNEWISVNYAVSGGMTSHQLALALDRTKGKIARAMALVTMGELAGKTVNE